MRIVMFDGRAVKKQHRTADGLSMVICFYDKSPPQIVSVEEWRNGATNKYYDGPARRIDVVRELARQN